jgi:DNA-binding MarR family transcriptional regulator
MSKHATVPFLTTLLVRDTCLCLHAQRAARSLGRTFDEALRPLGLTNGQFSLLMSLNRPDPPNMGSVASLLAMDRTTLTAALKPLERRGLVEISLGKDRRSRIIRLTPAGQTILAAAVPIWNDTHHEVSERIGVETAKRLRADLSALS